jgi:hypothetical protein
VSVECRRCGEFWLELDLALTPIIREEFRPYVSIATRQAWAHGERLKLGTDNWRGLADASRSVRVSAKVETALYLICEGSRVPGGSLPVNPSLDYPLFGAVNSAELSTYLAHLVGENFVTGPITLGGDGNYSPTIKGWQAIEPMTSPGGEPDRCFVAMWFADDLDVVYQTGFVKALEGCGFRPYRVKEDPTNKAVIDRILAEIRRSHFVVADFTGNRPSVYYEAGFARGVGREVISTCREGETSSLAFDTRHLGHVVWKDAEDLRIKLTNSVQANVIPRQ